MSEAKKQPNGINPYVGPRAFKYGERLYGREAEVPELLDLLISERIVLLHSPSGAGKTSLIQAGLIPELEKNKFAVWPVLRVDLGMPQEWNVDAGANRYVASVVQSLEPALGEDLRDTLSQLAGKSLQQIFNALKRTEDDAPAFEVLIFDQFEEIFTVDPIDKQAKRDFFLQLGELLRERNRWALFVMREEYIAALNPYLRTVPTHLNTQFHLELLGEDPARRAIQSPAETQGVDFETAAARALVDDLRQVQVQAPDGTTQWQSGPYVEPVQLQVVCRRLWEKRQEKNRITEKDIGELEDVNAALAGYYADSVTEVAAKTGVNERQIRNWFETALITKEGIRSRILKEPVQSKSLDNGAIQELVNTHLVRIEESQYRTWFELAHDRLVQPVVSNNKVWRELNLKPWQRQAELWWQQGEPKRLLLDEQEIHQTDLWLDEETIELSKAENRYLQASREKATRLAKERKQRLHIRYLTVSTSGLLLVIFVLISIYAYMQWEPWGYFEDFETGKVSFLRSPQITIGRSTEHQNTINIADKYNYVSRMHLLATQGLKIYDNRSLNGTTVNAQFLPYGKQRELSSGDIVSLAGMAAIRFKSIEFAPITVMRISDRAPTKGWLLFVDGSNREVIPLTEQQYFLSLDDNGQVLLSQEKETGTLLRIEADEQTYVRIYDEKDSSDLLFKIKGDDYYYPEVKLPAGNWLGDYRIDWVDRYDNQKSNKYHMRTGVFRYENEGLNFQLIPLGFRK